MTPARACSQAEFAAALLDPALPCPPGIVAWNASDPTPRLAVYRNNVVRSLIDAIAETFPVVQALVGVTFFRAMASVFVRQAPPRSRILVHYGEEFPKFIEQFAPASRLPYLADVALLEMARVRAYHAADARPLTRQAMSLALPCEDRVGELCFFCHPSVAVIRSPYAVASLWSAHQVDGDIGAVDLFAGEAALVVRENLDVLVLRLPPGTADFVIAIQQGTCLGDAAGMAKAASAQFDLTATLALLISHGALTSVHLPGKTLS
ncbi:MAG: DNA-binding domain-containing protein [Burkholderiaceae bacterium]|nr:DNA-binding domain-containing protein [Burkholderiaceae bacterium]MDH3460280.1 DNA-binding domain-containing protein [Burkholderiaceae bacterium]